MGRPPIAVAIADTYEDTEPSSLDPRHILKKALKELGKELGERVKYFTSPEIKF